MYATAIPALIVLLTVGLIMVLHGTILRTILAVLVSFVVMLLTMGIGLMLGEGHAPPAFFIGALCLAAMTFGLLHGLIWATDRHSMLWTAVFAVPVSLVVGFVIMWFPSGLEFSLGLPVASSVLAVTLGLLLWTIHRRQMVLAVIFASLVSVVTGFIMLPFGLRVLYKLTRIYLMGALPTGVFFFVATLGLLLGLGHSRRSTPQPPPPAPFSPVRSVHAPLWKISLLVVSVGGLVSAWWGGYNNALRFVGGPSAVAVNPGGTRLYVYDSKAYAVTVIDTAANRRVGVLAVTHEPGMLFEDVRDARLYLLSPPWMIRGPQTVTIIDMTSDTILGTVDVEENAAPQGPQRGRFHAIKRRYPKDSSSGFSVSGIIELVDEARGRRTVIPFGPAVAIDPSGSRLYEGYSPLVEHPTRETPMRLAVAVRDATAGYGRVATIQLWDRPSVGGPGIFHPTINSLAVDPTGKIVVAGFNVAMSQDMVAISYLAIIDAAAGTVASEIPVKGYPGAIAFAPSGQRAYVPHFDMGTVSVVDLAGHMIAQTIKVGDSPSDVAVAPSGKYVYVANSGIGTVSVIDAAPGRLVKTIRPWSLTIPPDTEGTGARASYGLALLVLIAGLTLRYLMPTANNSRAVLTAMTVLSGMSFFFSFISGFLIAPNLANGLWRLVIISAASFGLSIVSLTSVISSWLLFKKAEYRLAMLASLAPLINIVAILVFSL